MERRAVRIRLEARVETIASDTVAIVAPFPAQLAVVYLTFLTDGGEPKRATELPLENGP